MVKVEKLKADLNALLALCERTDNDIRSCLNTLQVSFSYLDVFVLLLIIHYNKSIKNNEDCVFKIHMCLFQM